MKLISHRGNISGRNETLENTKTYILNAISEGYDVEIDVWYQNNRLYLGHDEPGQEVNNTFLERFAKYLWIHTKNIEAFKYFKEHSIYNHMKYFLHTNEDYVFTSHNDIWCYPGRPTVKGSIIVLPETVEEDTYNTYIAGGICSDNIEEYKRYV